jgi:hypothetical protein
LETGAGAGASDSLPAGAIAGIVIAVIAACLGAAFLILFLMRRRRAPPMTPADQMPYDTDMDFDHDFGLPMDFAGESVFGTFDPHVEEGYVF